MDLIKNLAIDNSTKTELDISKISNWKQVVVVIIALAIVPISMSITFDTILYKMIVVGVLAFLAFYIIKSDTGNTSREFAINNIAERHATYLRASIEFLEDYKVELTRKIESSTGERQEAFQEVIDDLESRLNDRKLVYKNLLKKK